jgi:hypothetical protein
MTYLRNLTPAELTKTYEAADHLCQIPAYLDPELAIKLDTLRADLTAEMEDRAQDAPGAPQTATASRAVTR